jgi:hypothetical protein
MRGEGSMATTMLLSVAVAVAGLAVVGAVMAISWLAIR